MKISSIGLLLSLMIICSCNKLKFEKDCYLNLKLGMKKYEYDHEVRKYIKQGVLKEQFTKSDSDDSDRKDVQTTLASLQIKGVLEPIFLNDRLDQLRIFIGVDFSDKHSATIENYSKIVDYYKKEYGQPKEQISDTKTGHKLTIWNSNYDYSIEVAFKPPSDLSNKQIAIYFKPIGILKTALEEHNKNRKSE